MIRYVKVRIGAWRERFCLRAVGFEPQALCNQERPRGLQPAARWNDINMMKKEVF
jgi:hypothetical protein